MLLAAGRGERMRPLTDARPKPLLEAGGKPLIEWQIERLARAGFRDLVINHAHLGEQLPARLGDGRRLGVRIEWSAEPYPLETGGGIVQALPLLEPRGVAEVVLIVSADIWCDYDYSRLESTAERLCLTGAGLHLVMVANPPYHPAGDFSLVDGQLALDGAPKLTFGNIGLYRTDLFHALPRGEVVRLTPWYREWIARGRATGERFDGRWHNVGTPGDLARLDSMLSGAGAEPHGLDTPDGAKRGD